MADKQTIFIEFFQKTARDEKLLKRAHPQIYASLQAGGNMPTAILYNYMQVRDECQERIGFTADLMRRYADPTLGTSTPPPDHPLLQLPWFKIQGTQGSGLAGALRLEDLPRTVSLKDVIVGVGGGLETAESTPPAAGSLGFAIGAFTVVAIIAVLYMTGRVVEAILDA